MQEVEAKAQSYQAMRDESEARRDKVKADVEVALAKVDVAKAERAREMLACGKIKAPFDGVVTARSIDLGHFAQPASSGKVGALLVVQRSDRVRTFLNVPAHDAVWVNHPLPGKVGLPARARPGPGGRVVQGHVTRTARALDRRVGDAVSGRPCRQASSLVGFAQARTLRSAFSLTRPPSSVTVLLLPSLLPTALRPLLGSPANRSSRKQTMLRLLASAFSLVLFWAALPTVAEAAELPAAPKLVRSAKSGPWSAPATWEGGKVPGPAARVQVRTGHTVVYDRKSDQAIRSIHVAGTLTFAIDRDTRLDVGLIKIQPGDDASENGFDCDDHVPTLTAGAPQPALIVGSPNSPVPARYTALVRLVYFEGMDRQSCPAIVCCGGRMDFHGAPLSASWVKLGATANVGATVLALAETVRGWRVGDKAIITATKVPHFNAGPDALQTEERFIQKVEGKSLTLDRALKHAHLGAGDYRAEVANLSRNVIVESADPKGVRGHTMYHRGSAGSIGHAEFRHLGKEGVLGRYAIHYHLAGNSMRGSSIIGASVWDSHNRWITIHGTNYLVVRDCVGYRSKGHGFFLEDGTEAYNVLDRNLAVQALRGKPLPRQALPFDENSGAGFWWANSLNAFTRNVSCENGRYGFRFEATPTSRLKLDLMVHQPDGKSKRVDVRTLPFVRFEDNEAHCDGLYGLNLGEGVARIGPDAKHPFVVKNMKIWEVHYAFRPQVPSLFVQNMRIHRATYGVYHPNYDRHFYRDLLISETDGEPFNRGHDDDSVQHGVLAVDGLTFAGNRHSDMPLVQISDDNPTGLAESHFRNVKVIDRRDGNRRALVNLGGGPRPTPKTPKGVPIYLHDYYGPGRHAKVVSTRAKDLIGDGNTYRSEPPLTGDESRVAEVKDVAFPKVLDPIDDLPPATVITHVGPVRGGKVSVRGTTCDNGTVKSVLVNGKPARATAPNFAEWEIVLEGVKAGEVKFLARAEDAAGNVEKLPHVLVVRMAP